MSDAITAFFFFFPQPSWIDQLCVAQNPLLKFL